VFYQGTPLTSAGARIRKDSFCIKNTKKCVFLLGKPLAIREKGCYNPICKDV
jgi:hypothetical protein